MGNLIIVTILPGLIILTAFLFNIGTQETIDFKYGLSTTYFKPIAIIISFLYFIVPFLILSEKISNELTKDLILSFKISSTMIALLIIFLFIVSKFYKKRDEIFIKSTQYSSDNKINITHLEINKIVGLAIILICISSVWIFYILKSEIKLSYEMLITKKVDSDIYFLISLFIMLFILYSLTMITAGYLYNYGKLLDFRKYTLIYREPFNITLNHLEVNTEKNAIDVYVLVETENSMIIKIDKEELPSIKIKKDDIVNIINI